GQHHKLVRENINPMGITAVGSFLSGLLAVLCIVCGLGQNLDTIIIGTIMPEIPGLSFGDALRDLLCGDTVSGSLRLVQALLRALIMALGYMAALALYTHLGGGVLL
ncbi:MAG: hypothetical protein DBX65_03235, partial [Oscillospiraceae bacterium]